MGDVWDDIAGDVPAESQGGSFEKPPVGSWCLMKTAGPENGKAAPGIRSAENKSDGETFYSFETGLICAGGDDKVEDKHKGAYDYFSAYVHEKENHDKTGGRLTGFLNACFAPGVGDELAAPKGAGKDEKKAAEEQRARARWQVTVSKLRAFAIDRGISIEQFSGDKPRFIAGVACELLKEEAKYVLAKIGEQPNKKNPGEKNRRITSFEDVTAANTAERKVHAFDEDEAKAATGGSEPWAGWSK